MDTSKPFIGYKSAGRRPERQNDREGAKGAPLAAIRGWIAGTAGLPGDLEGLVRMLPGIERKEPVLPTSDFYKEWLPLRGESPVERAFTEAGSLAGGAGVGSAARGVERGVSAGARGALSAIEAAARNAAVPRTLHPQAGVIKMKGGNWLDGSVEDAIKPLRVRVRTEGINGHTAEHTASDQAINQWLDKKLARYVKNEMATPEDPIRALAERGVLHVNPEQLNFRPEMHGKYLERGQTAVAQNPAAKAWEGAADLNISPTRAGDLLTGDTWLADLPVYRDPLTRNPWLAKVPPETDVYALSVEPYASVAESRLADELGFNHLVDELRNATNPESGLPRELLWKYADLDKVTVPQAVERVAKINEWRAAQKAEADLARANNAATVLHKEYPDGYRWVELKKPEVDVSGLRFEPAFEGVRAFDESGNRLVHPTGGYNVFKTEDEARKAIAAQRGKEPLEQALKYEGDTMGHCVGGYCDAVASGRSRIYSLRDKKGQPHATVEAKVHGGWQDLRHLSGDPGLMRVRDLPEEILQKYVQRRIDRGAADKRKKMSTLIDSVRESVVGDMLYHPSLDNFFAAEDLVDPPLSITQIKGKQNRAPNPEYLPYVQDFVRSGQWSDVGDLHNTGLIGIDRESDLAAAFSKLGKESPRYVTQDELTNLLKWHRGEAPMPEGFSHGGAVNANDYDPNRVDALVQALEAEFQ